MSVFEFGLVTKLQPPGTFLGDAPPALVALNQPARMGIPDVPRPRMGRDQESIMRRPGLVPRAALTQINPTQGFEKFRASL